MEEVNSRLVRLERDLKICKFVIGLMGILVAALAGGEYVALRASRTLGAAAVPQRIEAHQFVVLDNQNRPVALLGELFPKQPVLLLSHGLKRLRMSKLPITKEGDAAGLDDLDKWPTLLFSADDSRANIDMRDQKKHSFISASIDEFAPSDADLRLSSNEFDAVIRASSGSKNETSGASFRMSRDISGKTPLDFVGIRGELDLELHEDGETALKMTGSHLNDLIELEAPAKANPALHLFDSDGNLRASLGSTSLEVTRTGAEETTAPSSLTFFDKKGKVLWQAPR